MSNDLLISTLPYLVILGVSDVLAGYAAYLAVSVWRGLAVPVYKSRALWTAFFAVLIPVASTVSGNVSIFIPQEFYIVGVILVYVILFPGTILVGFVFVDRTISTIIRLDYLRRDVLGWRSFRPIYWAFVTVQFILYGILPGYANNLIDILYSVALLVPLSYGSVAIVIGSRRTRDITFRLNAKWFGYCLASIVLVSVTNQLPTNIVLQTFPDILISFSLYKMARHLVPVARIAAVPGE